MRAQQKTRLTPRLAILAGALAMAVAAPAAMARDHGGYYGGGHGYHGGGYYGGGYRHHGGGNGWVAGALAVGVLGGLAYSTANQPTVVYNETPTYYPQQRVIYDTPPTTVVTGPGYRTYYYPSTPVVRERVIYSNGW